MTSRNRGSVIINARPSTLEMVTPSRSWPINSNRAARISDASIAFDEWTGGEMQALWRYASSSARTEFVDSATRAIDAKLFADRRRITGETQRRIQPPRERCGFVAYRQSMILVLTSERPSKRPRAAAGRVQRPLIALAMLTTRPTWGACPKTVDHERDSDQIVVGE
jgi:hypothetical protein